MISTVPAVLDALLSLWAKALPGVQVVDGQPLEVEPDVVFVGFTGLPGEPVVTSTRTREQAATLPEHEAYAITCLASSLRGETDAKQVRDRVYEMVSALAGELAADPTLGGLVARAELSTESFAQEQTNEGAAATLQFVVNVDAWTE
ncbi:hypothetical protein ACIBG7_43235 [Nonomuraea sp. NPDC050328]|uniref:hypothetical protein n=1 Tax=Nonomuraea sp. NPDC050328 TaxID=3364361 RepID=UPI0037AC0896